MGTPNAIRRVVGDIGAAIAVPSFAAPVARSRVELLKRSLARAINRI